MEEIHGHVHDGFVVPCDVRAARVGVGADDRGFNAAFGEEVDDFVGVFRWGGDSHAFLRFANPDFPWGHAGVF